MEERRNLDSVYFEIKGEEQKVCFSDLTEDQMRSILKKRKKDYVIELAITIGKSLREMGDQLDIICKYEGDTEDDNVF